MANDVERFYGFDIYRSGGSQLIEGTVSFSEISPAINNGRSSHDCSCRRFNKLAGNYTEVVTRVQAAR